MLQKMEHSANVIRIFALSIFEWLFYTGFTVLVFLDDMNQDVIPGDSDI